MPGQNRNVMSKEILTLRRSLSAVDRSLRRFASMLEQLDSRIERRKPRARTRRPLSTKARASLKLQGRYMGYMRQLKPRQKAQVRKIKETKGVKAAISKAKRLSERTKAA